jgi:hypothetical protein
MEYYKTRSLLHVPEFLGHRDPKTTMIYTYLVNFESDDFHSDVAKTIEESRELIEAGFEYICTHENNKLFRKSK